MKQPHRQQVGTVPVHRLTPLGAHAAGVPLPRCSRARLCPHHHTPCPNFPWWAASSTLAARPQAGHRGWTLLGVWYRH